MYDGRSDGDSKICQWAQNLRSACLCPARLCLKEYCRHPKFCFLTLCSFFKRGRLQIIQIATFVVHVSFSLLATVNLGVTGTCSLSTGSDISKPILEHLHVLFSGSFPSLWMGSALDNLQCRCSHSMFFLCLKDSKYPSHCRCSLCLTGSNSQSCTCMLCKPVSPKSRLKSDDVSVRWLLPHAFERISAFDNLKTPG